MPGVTLERFEKIKRLAMSDVARGFTLDTVLKRNKTKSKRQIVRAETIEINPQEVSRASPVLSPREEIIERNLLSGVLDAIEDIEATEIRLRAKYGIN
jgi:hypothetical protein